MEENKLITKASHYNSTFSIECKYLFVYLDAYLSNTLKYIYRWDHKGTPVQDLRKAGEYLDLFMINGNKIPMLILNKEQKIDLEYMLSVIEAEAESKNDVERWKAIESIFTLSEISTNTINISDILTMKHTDEIWVNKDKLKVKVDECLDHIKTYLTNCIAELVEV